MKHLLVAALCLLTSACASWPKEGQGGWAENFHYGNETPSVWYSQSQGLLQHDFDHLSLRLEIMRASGIRQCMPAQHKLATLMQNRIQRQMAASMFSQSQHDIVVFYHQINLLQNHFTEVNEKTGCASFTMSNTLVSDTRNAALSLLNSDNQFAFADDNLTPKYRDKIKQAAELLKLFDSVELLLVGHTDHVGTPHDNIQLGIDRARKVAQALQDEGLTNATISTVSQGESAPYSNETTVAARLSNRRVVAHILSANGENPTHQTGNSTYGTNIPLLYWTQALNSEQGERQ